MRTFTFASSLFLDYTKAKEEGSSLTTWFRHSTLLHSSTVVLNPNLDLVSLLVCWWFGQPHSGVKSTCWVSCTTLLPMTAFHAWSVLGASRIFSLPDFVSASPLFRESLSQAQPVCHLGRVEPSQVKPAAGFDPKPETLRRSVTVETCGILAGTFRLPFASSAGIRRQTHWKFGD